MDLDGARVTTEENRCIHCGVINLKKGKFCKSCGKLLDPKQNVETEQIMQEIDEIADIFRDKNRPYY